MKLKVGFKNRRRHLKIIIFDKKYLNCYVFTILFRKLCNLNKTQREIWTIFPIYLSSYKFQNPSLSLLPAWIILLFTSSKKSSCEYSSSNFFMFCHFSLCIQQILFHKTFAVSCTTLFLMSWETNLIRLKQGSYGWRCSLWCINVKLIQMVQDMILWWAYMQAFRCHKIRTFLTMWFSINCIRIIHYHGRRSHGLAELYRGAFFFNWSALGYQYECKLVFKVGKQ